MCVICAKILKKLLEKNKISRNEVDQAFSDIVFEVRAEAKAKAQVATDIETQFSTMTHAEQEQFLNEVEKGGGIVH